MDDKSYNDGNSTEHRPDSNAGDTETATPRRRTPWETVDGRVISLVSRKGGVGKTTSAVNLGAALALSGHTVLLVGVDPQCGVCRSLGSAPEELTTGLAEIFSHHRALTDLVQTSPLRDLFFVSPRIDSLKDEEEYLQWLAEKPDEFVREIDQARILYDTILIDCPPNLGAATRAALLASDSYLVPIQAEELCRSTVDHLLEFVGDFRERNFSEDASSFSLDPDIPSGPRLLNLEGMFLTMASTRTRMGQHVAARVSEDFGDLMFSAAIPRTTRLSEMALRGKPAVIYDRRSPGSRAYFDLADELVYRFLQDGETDEAESTVEVEAGFESNDAPATEAVAPKITAWEDLVAKASAPDVEEPVQKEPGNGNGLDRFLSELGGAREVSSQIPSFEEPSAPEMVSLDDLLAEEESGDADGDDWGDGSWPSPRRPH